MPAGRRLAIAVAAGAAIGVQGALPPWPAWAAALAAASLAVLPGVRPQRTGPVSQRPVAPVRQLLVLTCVFCASAAHAAHARARALAPPLAGWFASRADPYGRLDGPVHLDGVIVRDAEPTEGGVRLLLDVGAVGDETGWHRVPGRVRVHVSGVLAGQAMPTWTAGRRLRAPVALRTPPANFNPGLPGPDWQALQRPYHLTGTIKSAALVDVAAGTWWTEATAAARARVRTATRHLFPTSPRTAGVVTAILIGDRAGLDRPLEQRLQIAGTYHVIAISGGNIAIITALLLFVLQRLSCPVRAAPLVTMAVVAAYGLTVAGDASVVRATTAACVYLSAARLGLMLAALDVLSVVAILVIVADPLAAADVGAWLSFGATLGIVVGAGRRAGHDRPAGAVASSASWRPRRVVVTLLVATMAAELAVLPVSAAVFHRVGVAGLLLNFVAIPAMAVVQVAGLTAVALAFWCPAPAALAAATAHAGVIALVESARLVEIAPWLSWRVPPPPLWSIAGFYAAVACALHVPPRHGCRRAAVGLAAVGAVLIAVGPMRPFARPPSGWLRVTTIDVGQGEALLVQFPGGRSLLVDAGASGPGFDAGERLVAPALWALGVRRLDWLLVTHPDLDHAGGAASVARLFGAREIWEGVPVPADPMRAQLRAAYDRGAAWRQLQRGDQFEAGGATLAVLHPPLPDWERQRARNDDSVVLRVSYGDVELLLTGDIGRVVEHTLGTDATRRPIRVLKVAHHGSRTSSDAMFVDGYRPAVALISAGRANPFGHPAPEVTGRLTAAGARIFRTDRDGAVILETDGRELRVRTMAGRRWGMRAWPAGA